MARTMGDWLTFLTAQMDRELVRISPLYDRVRGAGPLPEMGPNLRTSWRDFQKRARVNPAKMIVEALSERVVPNGVTVGDSLDTPASLAARRIYRDNRLNVVFRDAVDDSGTCGVGYLLVTVGEDGKAVITRESPEWMYVEPDPVRPWRGIGAIKVWRDTVAEIDYLSMWVDGVKTTWQRESRAILGLRTKISGDWRQSGTPEFFSGTVPVVILENKNRMGEFEIATDLIDRISWQTLQRLVIIAMQAFRQRALETSKDEGDGLPDTDDEGNEIDYQELFEPGPGALWELPAGVKLWESQQTSFQEILNATKDDWKELSAETRTPLSVLLPDSANQSAAGAEAPQRQLVAKAEDRVERFKPALAVAIVKALAIEDVDLAGETVEISFEPPHAVSLTEKYAAAVSARNAGESIETIQRNILGYSQEQIDADRAFRAQAMFDLALGVRPDEPARA